MASGASPATIQVTEGVERAHLRGASRLEVPGTTMIADVETTGNSTVEAC